MENELELKDKIDRIDMHFRSLNLQKSDVLQEHSPQTQRTLPSQNFNSRGEVMLSPKEIRDNYDQALYCFKWYQIPLCRKSITRKVKFWAPSSVVLAWTYGEYIKKKDPANALKGLPFKFYLKSFLIFFAATTIYCFAQSLLYDEFCDIESPFYQQTETRLSIAKKIKAQMKSAKDGSILTSIFG